MSSPTGKLTTVWVKHHSATKGDVQKTNLGASKTTSPCCCKGEMQTYRKSTLSKQLWSWCRLGCMSIANRSDLDNSRWKQNCAAYWCRETTTVNIKLRGVKSEEKQNINSPFNSFSSLSFIYLLFTLPLLFTTVVQTNNQDTQFYTNIQQQQNPNNAGVTKSLWTKEDVQQQRC